MLGGVHTGVTCHIPLNRPCMVAMRPVVKLLFKFLSPWCFDIVWVTVRSSGLKNYPLPKLQCFSLGDPHLTGYDSEKNWLNRN